MVKFFDSDLRTQWHEMDLLVIGVGNGLRGDRGVKTPLAPEQHPVDL